MLTWFHHNHISPGKLATFEDLYAKVDDFFDALFGDDIQGVGIRAAKLNWEQALPTFRKMADAIRTTDTSTPDRGAAATVAAFESFVRTSAAFTGNVSQDPSWFCGEPYYRFWNHLPRPLIVVESNNFPIPVTPDMEQIFDIHQAAEFVVHDKATGRIADLAPQLLNQLPAGSARFARQVSMRPALVRALSNEVKLPIATQFEMPPVDLESWVQHYEGATDILRLLINGEESACTPLAQQPALSVFAVVGTDIYGLGGRLDMPSAADAVAAVVRDPYMDPKYKDPDFLKLLSTLRRMKGRSDETVKVDPLRTSAADDSFEPHSQQEGTP
jgi:hypothetical protein